MLYPVTYRLSIICRGSPIAQLGQLVTENWLYALWLIVGEGGKKKKKKKKSKKKKATQSEPPRVGLSKLFPDGNYPEGELQPYKDEYV